MRDEVKRRIKEELERKTGNLNLKACELIKIPIEISKMTWLKSLDLSANEITNISGLEFLNTLYWLDLSNNKLSIIEGLKTLTSLNELSLSSNQITKIKGLETLIVLDELNLSSNQITKIENLETLISLKGLDLHSNQLTKIEGLEQLAVLNSLNLSDNHLTKIEGLEKLEGLIILDLSSNYLQKIEGLKKLTLLNSLGLSYNQLTKIEGLENLTLLNKLFLLDNQISIIEGLEKLNNLNTLELSYNLLTKIQGLDQLKSLNVLNLSINEFTKIEGLEQLISLKKLDLSSNKITKIEGLEQLKALNKLYIYNNRLTIIEGLYKIPELNELNLSFNKIIKIKGLEEFVVFLGQIKEIDISKNPFDEEEWLNPEILKQVGKDVNQLKLLIQNYLKNQRKIKYEDLPLKIILLGNSQAGKSTTALSLISEGDNPIEREPSTHGLLIKNLNDTNTTKAIIYDFGGQDYYHNTYNMFFSSQSLFLVLWRQVSDENKKADASEMESYHFNQKYWLGNIKYYFSKINDRQLNKEQYEWMDENSIVKQPVFLVQNLFEGDEVEYKLDRDDITEYSIKKQFHVSFPLENDKDTELFKLERQSLFQSINAWINSNKTIQQKGFTEEHLRIFNAVIEQHEEYKEMAEPINLVSFCHKFKLKGYDQWFLGILHDRGIIYYLKEKDKIWLNPEGISYTIHNTINQNELKDRKGQYEKGILEGLFTSDMMTLMKDAGILHFDDFDKLHIIPQYLSLKPENDPLHDLATMDIDNGFYIRFKDYVPHGLMPRLICRFGANPGKKHYYRDQIIFSLKIDDKGYMAKVQITLDFALLKLSVMLALPKHMEYLRNKIYTYLFKSVLSAYWDYSHMQFLPSQMSYRELDKFIGLEDKKGIGSIWLDEIQFCVLYHHPNSKIQKTEDVERDSELSKALFGLDYNRLHLSTNIDMFLSTDDKWYIDYKKQLYNKDEYPPYINLFLIENNKIVDKQKSVSTSVFNPFLPKSKNIPIPKKLFISYSSKNSAYMNRFKTHLNPLKKEGLISIWVDRMITTGTEWDAAIQSELETSDILVYLLSPDFLETNYIIDIELAKGIEFYEERKNSDKPTQLYFIQLTHNSWSRYKVFNKVQHFLDPTKTGKEIVYIDQPDNDEAWVKVINDLVTTCLDNK